MDHLTAEDFLRRLEGDFENDRKQDCQEHLQHCAACAVELEAYKNLLLGLADDPLEPPPAEAIHKAYQIFQNEKSFNQLVDVVAELVFDSWASQPVGIRGAADDRQLLLRAGEFDIHLGMEIRRNQVHIRGQLMQSVSDGPVDSCMVHLLNHDDEIVASATVNELGEFIFAEASPEASSMKVVLSTGDSISWQIPGFDKGDSSIE